MARASRERKLVRAAPEARARNQRVKVPTKLAQKKSDAQLHFTGDVGELAGRNRERQELLECWKVGREAHKHKLVSMKARSARQGEGSGCGCKRLDAEV